jgi:hypothetical protein
MRTLPIVVFLAACGPTLGSNANRDSSFEDETDVTPPEIDHAPIDESMPLGQDVTIVAIITDEGSGVVFTRLFYKNETDASDQFSTIALAATGNENEYSAVIDGDEEASGGMNYYIEAVDGAQNTAWSPTEGPDDPYHFRVYPPEE